MDTPTAVADPVALIRQFSPDDIRRRIETLDRERKALLVLLRAARKAQPADRPREAARAS